MDKINFVNGSQPAINDTNLNQMQENIENEFNTMKTNINSKMTELLGEESNAAEITLNGTPTDYDLLLILYRTNDYYRGSVVVEPTESRRFQMIGSYIASDAKGGSLKIRISRISGNKIVKEVEGSYGFGGSVSPTENIFIYSVLGIKKNIK